MNFAKYLNYYLMRHSYTQASLDHTLKADMEMEGNLCQFGNQPFPTGRATALGTEVCLYSFIQPSC